MNDALLAPVLDTAITVVAVLLLALLVKKLLARASGARAVDGREIPHLGGWSDLEPHFATDHGPTEPIARAASVMVGATARKNCTAIGIEETGLRLAVKVPLLGGFGRRPLLIPWEEIVETAPARLWWGPARRLVVGSPPIATLTLPEALFEAILARGHLARRPDPRSARDRLR